MPYSSKQKKAKYQREWIAKRRKSFFKDKHCVKCGSTQNLELDHIDPSRKITHKIWSWSKDKRQKELDKCQVLCSICHTKKSVKESKKKNRKLSDNDITLIRHRASQGETHTSISNDFPVTRRHIGDVINNKYW